MRISVKNLSHSFFGQNGASLKVLNNISFTIQSREFVALIGPSGCGKSTLLKLLCGLLQPSKGEIRLGEMRVSSAISKKEIGWLAQNPALLPWKTVQENVSLAQKINPRSKHSIFSPRDLLELVGLGDFVDAYPHTLSGGMQQRVTLARTIALGANIWLMDEPFAALDELTRETLINEVLLLRQRFRPTTLWVSHHIYECVHLADRVLVMSSRPAQIIVDVEVGLQKPRDESHPEFQKIVKLLRETIKYPHAGRHE